MAGTKTAVDDPFAELNSLFSPTDVPEKISPAGKQKKTGDTIEELRASKVEAINNWLKKLREGTARPEGKQSKGNLSVFAGNKDFVIVRLPHGPAGNLKLYVNGEWKETHTIPAVHEVSFWNLTTKIISGGHLDEELNAAKERMKKIYYNEDGTKKVRERKPKNDASGSKPTFDAGIE